MLLFFFYSLCIGIFSILINKCRNLRNHANSIDQYIEKLKTMRTSKQIMLGVGSELGEGSV